MMTRLWSSAAISNLENSKRKHSSILLPPVAGHSTPALPRIVSSETDLLHCPEDIPSWNDSPYSTTHLKSLNGRRASCSPQISSALIKNGRKKVTSMILPRSPTTSSITTCDSNPSIKQFPSARRPRQYASITQWFLSGSETEQQKKHKKLKDSIKVIRPIAMPCATNVVPTSIRSSSIVSNPLEENEIKRERVIQELFLTEKSYQKDVALIKEIYYDQIRTLPSTFFTIADIKLVFSNLLAILDFEKDFIERLTEALENKRSIARVFMLLMARMDEIYSEYCKRHDDVVAKLQELQNKPHVAQFLDACKAQMKGRTMSWDLASLLIKPVQRVLKYPLLLKEILSLTPSSHAEYADLVAATKGIQHVADRINEMKRRRDIVGKIVHEKRKMELIDVHSINKSLTRRAQRLKQTSGLAGLATHDPVFDRLYRQFERQRDAGRQLIHDIEEWVRQTKQHDTHLCFLAMRLENLYDGNPRSKNSLKDSLRAYVRLTDNFAQTTSHFLGHRLHSFIRQLETFLREFDSPAQVIQRRMIKLLDYDRVRSMKSKGTSPDKYLQASADAYPSINAQLLDELPIFLKLTSRYFDLLIADLANIQTQYYDYRAQEWHHFAQLYLQGALSSNIVGGYQEAMMHVPSLKSFRFFQPARPRSLPEKTQPFQISAYHPSRSSADDSYFRRTYNSWNYEKTPIPSNHYTQQRLGDYPRSNISLNRYAPIHEDEQRLVSSSSLFDGCEPIFECLVITQYQAINPEYLTIQQGDILQVWLADNDHSNTRETWWYASLEKRLETKYGWIPAWHCHKL
ncbi:uncharacterized protein BYT42DRAFT_555674 [Radiomyces spectabilis]|uniref:uncharacterized protein n=1 Tax=Radiomyces spectabilis TaxID=64574 RepID=UPI00221F35B2|nr:uncharacterized protein BYT42DRAFT_555674 [Radiomyces spectabilis]KAI8391115.1 hypothetical protein BYT42DRAFT_555674 [Radiomyces spectabilis]